jgi:hypothetical protein
MFEIVEAYVEQTPSWYLPADCRCGSDVDGTVSGISCNEV